MRVFVTGDTHWSCTKDYHKLGTEKWSIGKTLTRDDLVIVCGDFGFFKQIKRQITSKKYTLAFIDGNHEPYSLINEFPTTEKWGGKVGVIYDNLFWLKRGQVFTFGQKKFFTMGGATSQDRAWRLEGHNWWPEEIPSYQEWQTGYDNLLKHDNKVDVVLAHTCPDVIAQIYSANMRVIKKPCKVGRDLDFLVQNMSFDNFYFGHWHDDWTFGKYRMLYHNIVQVGVDHEVKEDK